MADPKYANLPGIAYDQPDVYETSDLPEVDQVKNEPDEESDSIERFNISAPEAFTRFKDKSLTSENVDFSDRLSKHRRIGYDARSGDWELVCRGEKETPLQRYQRLQCEIKELLEEIATIKESGNSNEVPTGIISSNLEGMLRQLEGLKLEQSLGTEIISTLSDPQGAQFKKLITQLEKLGGGARQSGEEDSKTTGTKWVDGEVKYQVLAKPSQSHVGQAARLADLEMRVHKLNSLVATSHSAVKRLGGGDKSLVETARWVCGKTALLDGSQLEAAEARLSVLLARMDQLAERVQSLTSTTSETDTKIAELYELAKSTEDMSQVVPRTLERMLALEALHHQGMEFAKSLSELDSMQRVLTASCESNKEVLRRLEERFATDLVTLKANMEALDSRIKALTSKCRPK